MYNQTRLAIYAVIIVLILIALYLYGKQLNKDKPSNVPNNKPNVPNNKPNVPNAPNNNRKPYLSNEGYDYYKDTSVKDIKIIDPISGGNTRNSLIDCRVHCSKHPSSCNAVQWNSNNKSCGLVTSKPNNNNLVDNKGSYVAIRTI